MNQQSPDLCDADPQALTIAEAQKRISSALCPIATEEIIACSTAMSRVTAEPVFSPIALPPFRASAMDGYALRVEDCNSALKLKGISLAGHPGENKIPAGSCQRIMTGAVVPDNADAVVQQENTTVTGETVKVSQIPTVGLNIRNPGSDCAKGTCLLEQGCVLGSAELALLAAHGIRKISVKKPLKIAVFSTGDELVDTGEERAPGQIYDANRALLCSLLQDPAIEVLDLGIARDTTQDVVDTIKQAGAANMIISSGGVSVGDADTVRSVLEQRGSINLWKIAVKPGRPLTFATLDNETPYFGLPGNPVSAGITCLLFVKPAICHLLGIPSELPPPLTLPLVDPLRKNPGRVEYQRGRMQCNHNGEWEVSTTGLQDSHVLSSLHEANCLIELPLESQGASPGERVKVIPFAHFRQNRL
ncbi:MAG: molybdopterin molybdotransferase MoeA [Granulosicoccus sp.]|nr:molybdopterin molybdotransferase MoeA [Granulosicoccus sp.]